MPGVGLVPQLEGLVDASGGARGDGGPEDALLGRQVDLDGGVAAAVVDLPGVDLLDGHDGGEMLLHDARTHARYTTHTRASDARTGGWLADEEEEEEESRGL